MAEKKKDILLGPIFVNNPIALQILGICSALAVTTSLNNTMIMCAAVIAVMACSNAAVSLIRNHIPGSIRIIVQMTIIASLVIIVDQVLKAYAFEASKELSVFVGLIITNCIVMGRAEAFAMKNGIEAQLLGRHRQRARLQYRPDFRRVLSRVVWCRSHFRLSQSSFAGDTKAVGTNPNGLMLLRPAHFSSLVYSFGYCELGRRIKSSTRGKKSMEAYLNIFVKSSFIENLALAFFLGMCTFLAVFEKVDTSVGLGIAVIAVQTITIPSTILFTTTCWPTARSLGLACQMLTSLSWVSSAYIGVIAVIVQILEMTSRFFPPLYNALGIFLPLITVNCAILGGSLFMVERDYSFSESVVFGFGSGIGFALAIAASSWNPREDEV